MGGGLWRESKRRRKLGLITSCIFKQAHAPRGKESSILGEAHEETEAETELVSEVEVRSCWADAVGVMGGGEYGGATVRGVGERPTGIIKGRGSEKQGKERLKRWNNSDGERLTHTLGVKKQQKR